MTSSHPSGQPGIVRQLRRLDLTSVEPAADGAKITIGGISDNTAGLLHLRTRDGLPPITPDGYIYIARAAPHWYVFRTT